MKIIVGLGNPGSRYKATWHNLGFMVVDKLAEKQGLTFKAGRGEYFSASGFFCSSKVILAKPTTFMNLSGRAVRQIMDYYKIGIEDLLVVYDDINLSMGSVRVRKEGSAGGHNGLKSLIEVLGTNQFARLRVGFKTDQISSVLSQNRGSLPDVVLSQIPKKLENELEFAIGTAEDCIYSFLENGIVKTMNIYNKKES